MRGRPFTTLCLLTLVGCTSFWQQRDYQEVTWADGDDSRIEVWLRQGTVSYGQPWMSLLDILGTPVIWIADVTFAWAALQSDEARIAGGPVGLCVSFLPFFTCMPLDVHTSSYLDLGRPLQLSVADRHELAGLSAAEGTEWLVRHDAATAEDPERRAEIVRYFVAGVRLVPAGPDDSR